MTRVKEAATWDPIAALKHEDGLMLSMIVAKALRPGNFAGMLRERILQSTLTPVPPADLWADTNRLCNEDDPHYGEPLLEAAE